MTFVGQFIDHDLTFDATSQLGVATEPDARRRTAGPRGSTSTRCTAAARSSSRELYDPADPISFRVESGGQFEDLPRRADHSAVIGDSATTPTCIISGLHAAFLKFHNNAVDAVGPRRRPSRPRPSSRRGGETTWHYQWLVVNRVLPNFVGQPLVDELLRARTQVLRTATARPTSRSSSPARRTGSGTAWCGRRTGQTWPGTTVRRSSA